MTYPTRAPFSDSVNLGSNPSPPATRNTDKTGVSHVSGAQEQPEHQEQNAHAGRTKVGTAPVDRDQVAHVIVETLSRFDVEDFVQSDWTDRTTEEIMRRLVRLGALPQECSPEFVEP